MFSRSLIILITSIFVCISGYINAQRFTQLTVIAAYGHEGSSASYKNIVHTSGELMVETFNGVTATKLLTQGFHQDNAPVTKVQSETGNIVLYPNPVKDVLYVKFNNTAYDQLSIDLFDITGKKIMVITENDPLLIHKVDFTRLNKGIYFIRIRSKDGSVLHTQKIEKTH